MDASPFLSLWIQPRATMKRLLEREPSGWVVGLAILAGISQALFGLMDSGSAPRLSQPLVVLFALVSGFIGGLIGLYLSTYLLRWSGRWLGGRNDFYAIWSAVGWSSLPMACSLLLLVPMFALWGTAMLDSNWLDNASPSESYLLLGLSLVQLVLAIWGIVMLVKCLAEVQGFTAWCALANLLLAIAILVVPLVLIGTFFGGNAC